MAFFSGVSIVPRYFLDSTTHETVVRCTFPQLKQPIHLERNGVFRISAEALLQTYTENDRDIQYVRVFPARARVLKRENDKIVIRVDNRQYEHEQGIDVIVPSMILTNHFPLLFPGEEIMV